MGKPSRTRLEVPVNGVDEDLLVHSPAIRPVVEAVRVAAGRRTPTLRQARAQFEREWIASTLAMHHGSVGEAAKALGIQRTNLYRKVRQLKVPLR
jgi:DNA-binding NtrC family response regulator